MKLYFISIMNHPSYPRAILVYMFHLHISISTLPYFQLPFCQVEQLRGVRACQLVSGLHNTRGLTREASLGLPAAPPPPTPTPLQGAIVPLMDTAGRHNRPASIMGPNVGAHKKSAPLGPAPLRLLIRDPDVTCQLLEKCSISCHVMNN